MYDNETSQMYAVLTHDKIVRNSKC